MVSFDTVDLDSSEEVECLVRYTFAASPARLAHVLTVASHVRETAERLDATGSVCIDVDYAYRAALLHDIGYAPELQETGFHPIDGARYLERRGYPTIAADIICHSNSPELARLRGLPPISVSTSLVAELITYWDVQVAQGGIVMTYADRMSEIRARHSAQSDVCRAHEIAEERIQMLRQRIDELLGQDAAP